MTKIKNISTFQINWVTNRIKGDTLKYKFKK